MRLPAPMLARSGQLPAGPGWAFEVKWDGFRCVVSTEDGFRARSRRGWNMTEHLLEFTDLPVRGVFDGELVAFGDDGRPDFDLVCRRLLHGDEKIPLAYLIFDLLSPQRPQPAAETYFAAMTNKSNELEELAG